MSNNPVVAILDEIGTTTFEGIFAATIDGISPGSLKDGISTVDRCDGQSSGTVEMAFLLFWAVKFGKAKGNSVTGTNEDI